MDPTPEPYVKWINLQVKYGSGCITQVRTRLKMFFKGKLRQKQTKISRTEWKKAIGVQPRCHEGVMTIHILNWQGEEESFTCDTSICIRLWLLYPPPSVPAADASVEKDCCLEASLHSQSPAVISTIVPHASQRKWGISELDNLCLSAHSSWHAEWFYSRPIFFPEKKREQNAAQLVRMWVETKTRLKAWLQIRRETQEREDEKMEKGDGKHI